MIQNIISAIKKLTKYNKTSIVTNTVFFLQVHQIIGSHIQALGSYTQI